MNYQNNADQNQQYIASDFQGGLCVGQQQFLGQSVGEKLSKKIQKVKDELEKLEATKASLEKANLLDLKIGDLRQALDY